jgi:hypothetical protein
MVMHAGALNEPLWDMLSGAIHRRLKAPNRMYNNRDINSCSYHGTGLDPDRMWFVACGPSCTGVDLYPKPTNCIFPGELEPEDGTVIPYWRRSINTLERGQEPRLGILR